MPDSIAKYLVHLAQFPSAWSRHHRSKQDALDAMNEFGLCDRKAQIVLAAQPESIVKEINDNELRYGAASTLEDASSLAMYRGIVHLPPDEPSEIPPEPPAPPEPE